MGIRSDVAICLKHHIYHALSSESKKLISECFQEPKTHNADGLLFYTESIKWYSSTDPDIISLYFELDELDAEDYLILEACGEYPTSTEGCVGDWWDNPWNLRRTVSVELDWMH